MTDAYALRNMVEDEQTEFAALLRGLNPRTVGNALAVSRLVSS